MQYSDIYMIAADLMKYVFFFLIAFILLRLFILSLREWRAGAADKRKRRNAQMGYISLIEPEDICGEQYNIYCETLIGKSRSCDITLAAGKIALKHARIFESGGEIFISSLKPDRNDISVNDKEIGREDRKLSDGDTVEIAGVKFHVYLDEAV